MGSKIEIPTSFRDSSADEQLDYISRLWELVRGESDTIPVPDWHREILRDRLARARVDPPKTTSWNDVKSQLP